MKDCLAIKEGVINKQKERLLSLEINMYIIQGTRCQSDVKFKNRGVQCTAIAVVSCCKAFLNELSEWSERDVNECLKVKILQFCGYVSNLLLWFE